MERKEIWDALLEAGLARDYGLTRKEFFQAILWVVIAAIIGLSLLALCGVNLLEPIGRGCYGKHCGV